MESRSSLRINLHANCLYFLWCLCVYVLRYAQAPFATFNVEYAEHSVLTAIKFGKVLEGELLRYKIKLVQARFEIHREEIMVGWSLAVRGLPVQKIKPLE